MDGTYSKIYSNNETVVINMGNVEILILQHKHGRFSTRKLIEESHSGAEKTQAQLKETTKHDINRKHTT